jgi:predicted membrane protein
MAITTEAAEPVSPGIAALPLAIGLGLLVVMTILPGIATDAAGKADHTAAMLIFWSMSAGFVRGVGFIPQHALPRLLLSTLACLLALGLAGLRLNLLGRFG